MDPSASTQSGLRISFSIRNGDIPRHSVRISSRIEIHVHKSLRSNAAGLRIVHGRERLEVNIVGTIDVEFDSYIRGEIEVGVYKLLVGGWKRVVQRVHVRYPLVTLAGVENFQT